MNTNNNYKKVTGRGSYETGSFDMTNLKNKLTAASALFGAATFGFIGTPQTQAAPEVEPASVNVAAFNSSTTEQKEYSRKEAYRASTGRIVLHYGEGTEDANMIAKILNENGYPTIAIKGAAANTVSLFVNRSYPVEYQEADFNNGRLLDDASSGYDRRVTSRLTVSNAAERTPSPLN